MWTHLINLFYRTLLDLLPMVNPITTGLFFLNFIKDSSQPAIRRSAFKIGAYMAITLIIILLIGEVVLKFFNITLPFIRIAGGILIFSTGWNMLSAKKVSTSNTNAKLNDIIFYPMTMPFTVGGGTIAAILTLATHIDQNTFILGFAENIAVIVGILIISISVILCCFFAQQIKAILKDGGVTVFMFAFALILLPLGLSIGWSGVSTLIQTML